MWRCEGCGRTFANRNQIHTCRPLVSLDAHFAGKDPAVRATFDRIVEVVAWLTEAYAVGRQEHLR